MFSPRREQTFVLIMKMAKSSSSTLFVCLLTAVLIQLPYLILATTSTSTPTAAAADGFSIKILSSDLPESPLYTPNLTQSDMIAAKMRTLSTQVQKHKANILQLHDLTTTTTNSSSSSSFSSSGKWRWPFARRHFFYSADLIIGSEESVQHLLIDTGSSVIWTQCEPCTHCFEQHDPIYNRRSSSFRPLPCDHPLCQDNPFSCLQGYCRYKIGYTGASTEGFGAFETFQIDQYPPHTMSLERMVFGCSDNSQAKFDDDKMISGILGMDRGGASFISQLSNRFLGNSFSYCMPPFQQAAAPHYFLRFGNDIPRTLPATATIPVISPYPNNVHFYLPLEDISVGSRRLNLPPGTFDVRQTFFGGLFIDTGAPYSVFEEYGPNPYGAITDAFHDYYKKLDRTPYQPQGFDLCYFYPPGFYTDFASMTYHFKGGVDYIVKAQYMHYFDEPSHFFCVVLGRDRGVNILGAYQQQDMRIIHDVAGKTLKFNWEDCNKDVN